MKNVMKIFVSLVSLSVLIFVITQCSPVIVQEQNLCGTGYKYSVSDNSCILETSICNPPCRSDYLCTDGKCVPRISDEETVIRCSVTCGPGSICENGRCMPAPCNPPCQGNELCISGSCSPVSECIPPCSQTGFICVQGLCQRLCPPPSGCPKDTACSERGICEKQCNPKCSSGFFCNNGKCQKLEDADGDGFLSNVDCNDNDKSMYPGATEVCDGKDNNCDGLIDNIIPRECYDGPSGTLGRGICRSGRTACQKGKEICIGAVLPTSEVCDGKDNDCNGLIDDNCGSKPPVEQPIPDEKMPEQMPIEPPPHVDGGSGD